jgi:uroporphyrinogen-III decarboxylase
VQDKSEDEVYVISRKLVDKFKDQKYLLAAGCEITVLTPHKNLIAMRRASIT